jgi:hypothetical protein
MSSPGAVSLTSLIPMMTFTQVPNEEKEDARYIHSQLIRLCHHVDRVGHGLSLLDHCESQVAAVLAEKMRLIDQRATLDHAQWARGMERAKSELNKLGWWKFIAARDIVITVDDFYDSMTSSNSLIKRCKAIRQRINIAAVDRAHNDFKNMYPDHGALRNAACHLVDYSSKPDRVKKNRAAGPVSVEVLGFKGQGNVAKIMITEALCERTITYTGDGAVLKMELTPLIVDNLARVVSDYFKALSKNESEK